MTLVSIEKCAEYELDTVEDCIKTSLASISFHLSLFAGKTVVLKPNFLFASPPESAIVTHPVFFHAVARIVTQSGGHVVLAESPAIESTSRVIRRAGYQAILDEMNITVADTGRKTVIVNPNEQRRYRRFEIISAVKDADIIINLPKIKTHGLTGLTIGAKNMFGIIPGMEKSRLHTTAPSPHQFAEFILDLNEAVASAQGMPETVLTLVDGILGMEGDGPGPSGKPRHIGVILAGTDTLAVDATAAAVVGFDPRNVTTVDGTFKRSSTLKSFNDIKITGVPLKEVAINNFKPAKTGLTTATYLSWPFTTRFFRNLVNRRPVINSDTCGKCGNCKRICPVDALEDTVSGDIKCNYSKCIRCYCCVEICPFQAIHLKKTILQSILRT